MCPTGPRGCRRGCWLFFPFDLEKAFDKVPRDRLWRVIDEILDMKGLSLLLEAGHEGTCYIIK